MPGRAGPAPPMQAAAGSRFAERAYFSSRLAYLTRWAARDRLPAVVSRTPVSGVQRARAFRRPDRLSRRECRVTARSCAPRAASPIGDIRTAAPRPLRVGTQHTIPPRTDDPPACGSAAPRIAWAAHTAARPNHRIAGNRRTHPCSLGRIHSNTCSQARLFRNGFPAGAGQAFAVAVVLDFGGRQFRLESQIVRGIVRQLAPGGEHAHCQSSQTANPHVRASRSDAMTDRSAAKRHRPVRD